MKRICLLLFITLLGTAITLTASAQKLSKWEKDELKKEKMQQRAYEKLDKQNAQADKAALASLQKGITAPFVERLHFYLIRDATVNYTSSTGYNSDRDPKNWETAHQLIDAAKAIPGAYSIELERVTDSLLLQRTDISLLFSDPYSTVNVLNTLKYLRSKDYSPEVNIRLATIYKKGQNVHTDDSGYPRWVQSFDSAYKFMLDAAVAGNPKAMGMIGDYKIFGDGTVFEEPSPASYKYLDTISAGIWYKKQFEAVTKNKTALTYDDSLSRYMLYKIAYGPGDIDEEGVKCYNNNEHKTAYKYWLASMTFRNSAFAFYRIGYLYVKGEGGLGEFIHIAKDYLTKAGDLGYAPGYYAAALAEDFGSAKRNELMAKAAAMGYQPAGAVISRDNARLNEMNRISREKTRSYRNYYSDESESGDAGNPKTGNTKPRSAPTTRSCSSCGGSGTVHTTIPGGAKKNGVTIFGEYHTCTSCNGRGYY